MIYMTPYKILIDTIVDQMKTIVEWATSDVKRFVTETQLEAHVATLRANQDIYQLLRDVSTDEDFDRVRNTLAADGLARTLENYRQLESTFQTSIDTGDTAQACVVYKYMCDAKQLENLTLQLIDKNPEFGSKSTVIKNIEALLNNDAKL
jgi:uncharacterized protein YerC